MPNPKGNLKTLRHYEGKWRLGKTKTIRVPIVIADDLLHLARLMDEGKLKVDEGRAIEVSSLENTLIDKVKLLLSLVKKSNNGN